MAAKRDDSEQGSYAEETTQGQGNVDSGAEVEVCEPSKKSSAANAQAATDYSRQRRDDDGFYKSIDATQLYLNEIGFSPLLTPEEEVHYARLARRGSGSRTPEND